MTIRTPLYIGLVLLLAAAYPAAAGGPSIGGSLGSARVNQGDFEGNDDSWKLYAGTSFTEVIGGELGYIDFGRLGGNGPGARSWNLAATVGLPLGWVMPYGKAGVAFADIEGSSFREEYRDQDPYYGVGLRFGPRSSPVGLRLEYERFAFEQEDVDLASAGLEFRF